MDLLEVGLAELDREAREDALVVLEFMEVVVDVADGEGVSVRSGVGLNVDTLDVDGVELEDRDARKENEIDADAVEEGEILEEEVVVFETVPDAVMVDVDDALGLPWRTVVVCVLDDVGDFVRG